MRWGVPNSRFPPRADTRDFRKPCSQVTRGRGAFLAVFSGFQIRPTLMPALVRLRLSGGIDPTASTSRMQNQQQGIHPPTNTQQGLGTKQKWLLYRSTWQTSTSSINPPSNLGGKHSYVVVYPVSVSEVEPLHKCGLFDLSNGDSRHIFGQRKTSDQNTKHC